MKPRLCKTNFSITTRRPESPGRESNSFKVKCLLLEGREGRGEKKKEMKKKNLFAIEVLLNCFNMQIERKSVKDTTTTFLLFCPKKENLRK